MSKPTVMICDDNEDILHSTSLVLAEEGYTVITHNHTNGLISKVKSSTPSVILMDLKLPDQGGELMTRLIKQGADTQHIPVILFSANRLVHEAAERCQADGYVTKPFGIDELLGIVDTYT